jgi:hypothetical protein
LDTLNVNQHVIVPKSPFDWYWQSLTPAQEKSPEMKIVQPILQDLAQNNVSQVEVSNKLNFVFFLSK